ncbi:MAG: hypothetical protein MJ252_08710 [archaeon]|nr:hypothetical protein [archaeon]
MDQEEILRKAFAYKDNPHLNISDSSNYQIQSSHISYTTNSMNTNENNPQNHNQKYTNESFGSLQSSSVIVNNSNSYDSKENKESSLKGDNTNIDDGKTQFLQNFSNCDGISNLQISSNSIIFTRNLNNNVNSGNISLINQSALDSKENSFLYNTNGICNFFYDITPEKVARNKSSISILNNKPELKQINLAGISGKNQRHNQTINQGHNTSFELSSRSDGNNSCLTCGDGSGSKSRRRLLEKKTPIKYTRSQLKSGEKRKVSSALSTKNFGSNIEKTNNSSGNNKTNSLNEENSNTNTIKNENKSNKSNSDGISGRKNLMNTFDLVSKDKLEEALNENNLIQAINEETNENKIKASHYAEMIQLFSERDKNNKNKATIEEDLIENKEEGEEKKITEKEDYDLMMIKRKNDNFSFAINYNKSQIESKIPEKKNKNFSCERKTNASTNTKEEIKKIISNIKNISKRISNTAFLNQRENSTKKHDLKNHNEDWKIPKTLRDKEVSLFNLYSFNKEKKGNTTEIKKEGIQIHNDANLNQTLKNFKVKNPFVNKNPLNEIFSMTQKSFSTSKKNAEKEKEITKAINKIKIDCPTSKGISNPKASSCSKNKNVIEPNQNLKENIRLTNIGIISEKGKPTNKNSYSKNKCMSTTTTSSKGSKNNSSSKTKVIKVDLSEKEKTQNKCSFEGINQNKMTVINNFSNYRTKKQNKKGNLSSMGNTTINSNNANSNTSNSNSRNQVINHKILKDNTQIIFTKLHELPGDTGSQVFSDDK